MACDIRMDFEITPQMDGILSDLSARHGVGRAEMIRRSVALLSAATDAESKGMSVGAVSRDRESSLDLKFAL